MGFDVICNGNRECAELMQAKQERDALKAENEGIRGERDAWAEGAMRMEHEVREWMKKHASCEKTKENIALKAENERLRQENEDLLKHNERLLSSFRKEQDRRVAAEDDLERVKKGCAT